MILPVLGAFHATGCPSSDCGWEWRAWRKGKEKETRKLVVWYSRDVYLCFLSIWGRNSWNSQETSTKLEYQQRPQDSPGRRERSEGKGKGEGEGRREGGKQSDRY